MGRRAVAATLVSVVFFSTLLLANAAVYSAGGTYLSAALAASSQQREYGYASVLFAESSFYSLSQAEQYLGGGPIGCSSVPAVLSSMGGSQTTSGEEMGLDYTVSTTWAATTGGQASDNLTSMGRFSGYTPGDVNLIVTTRVDESVLGSLPSYQTGQQHLVHLPVALQRLASLCLSALTLLGQAVASLPYCNSSSVQEAVDSVAAQEPDLAPSDLGAVAQTSGEVCTVDYWVTIAQSYEGVSGTSALSLYGAGSFSS